MENETKPRLTVTTPEVTRVTSDSIAVTWNSVIEGVPEEEISFEVFVKGEMADGSPFDRVKAPERNSCTVTGLKAETTYSLFVVAVHGNEDIAQFPDTDDGVTATTLAKGIVPRLPPLDWKKIAIIGGSILALALLLYFLLRDSKPPVIDQTALSSIVQDEQVALTWHPAKDDNTAPGDIRYQVARTDESGNWLEPQMVQGDTTFTFTDLKPKSSYHFRIEALDKAGNGRAYEELSIDTPDTKAPTVENRTVKAKNITQYSFTLAWNPAKDNATPDEKILYRVYLKRDIELVYQLIKSDFGITSCPVTNLYDGSYYVFYVEAYDESGNMLTYGTDKAAFSAQTKY